MNPCPIAVVEAVSGPQHFIGVDAALRDRGCDATWIAAEPPCRLSEHTRVVAVADTRSFERLNVLRQARDIRACTVLLMDGIVEHRNTFLNPRAGPRFLRPAPVDVIACAGSVDRQHLETLGNDAVATGLPRLAEIGPIPLPTRPAVMVATALQPAFGDDEHRLLVRALGTLRERLDTHGVRVLWRLTGGLDVELGVEPDTGPLDRSLAEASAVITTPSTLIVEAMRARRPTALLFPFDGPCWPHAAWILDKMRLGRPRQADIVIRELLTPTADLMHRQCELLAEMHCEDHTPAQNVADLLVELVERPRRKDRPARLINPVRLPPRLAADRRPRVVSLVQCDVSPVGGVTTWSQRMARVFARGDLGYDFRTLLVVTHPDALADGDEPDALTGVCIVDPTADHWETMNTLRRAIERLEPSIVVPNYTELCYAAAMQLRPRGVRVVAVAHADDASYRDLLRHYDRWDAAVGVSDACMKWVGPMAGDRPVAKIVYGVPIGTAPRTVPGRGPLQIAYVGRMVEPQKRITDLLGVIDGLESRSVDYEFHMVGDGAGLAAWRHALDRRRLRHGRVTVHGRRSPQWVEQFLDAVDVSVLVSSYEGTSITMLESMGAGVVPAVTRVSSGVDEWIRDGDNGVVVPIGEPDLMAARIAAIAADRDRIADLGRAAWDTVRGSNVGVDVMAHRYRELFDEVMARPANDTPNDAAWRIRDSIFWCKEWAERPDEAMSWIMSTMQEAGYGRIAVDAPTPGCDAVILRAGGPDPVADRAAAYRRMGLGVAVWPHLVESPVADALHRVAKEALDNGCRRLAVYGVGRHTRRAALLLERGLPIVGFIDDNPPPWRRVFGLPIVTVDEAIAKLAPDAVVLSSDACEQRMWHRSAALRRAGVRVLPVYGTHDPAARLEAGVGS